MNILVDAPLVSVCMSSYNNSKYVLETLNSIANQTYVNIELIIVDDCSVDNSVEIIDTWLVKYDKPFVFIKNDKNLGVCKVANLLINSCSGFYISIIASDDIMMPDKLSNQVSLFEKAASDVGIVYSDAYLMDENGELFFSKFIQMYKQFFKKIPEGYLFHTLLQGNFIPYMTLLVKRECYIMCGGFDENLMYEDYDFLLRLSIKYKFLFSEYISAKYRIHSTNLHKKLDSVVALESNFKFFVKHVKHDYEADGIIKPELNRLLMLLYQYKSKELKNFVNIYYNAYGDNKMLYKSIMLNISYKKYLKLRSLYNNIISVSKRLFG